MIAFDIETGPLEESVIRRQARAFKSKLGPPPGKFNPDDVKLGRLKDEEKIKAKIAEAQQKHEAAIKAYAEKAKTEESDYWDEVTSKAALSPRTGRVLAIGYHSTDTQRTVLDISAAGNPEAKILERFWQQFVKCRKENRVLVGHNSSKFDIPFILKRSWVNQLAIPEGVLVRGGKFLNDVTMIDTMVMWGDFITLNDLATLFGVGAKPEDMDGSMFADVLKKDPKKAEAYLRNDVDMTVQVATRLGVI